MKKYDPKIDTHVAYAIGHTEAFLGIYARSAQIPEAELTSRVGAALLAQTGTVLGTPSDLSAVPGPATERDQALEPVEVAGRAHRNASQATNNKLRLSGRKKWWAKLTPRQKRIIVRRMQRAKKKKKS